MACFISFSCLLAYRSYNHISKSWRWHFAIEKATSFCAQQWTQ